MKTTHSKRMLILLWLLMVAEIVRICYNNNTYTHSTAWMTLTTTIPPSSSILTTTLHKHYHRIPKRSPRQVYWCGFANLFQQGHYGLGEHLFPEQRAIPEFLESTSQEEKTTTTTTTTNTTTSVTVTHDDEDILLYPGGAPNVAKRFHGKILYFNGESTWPYQEKIILEDDKESHNNMNHNNHNQRRRTAKEVFPVSAVDYDWDTHQKKKNNNNNTNTNTTSHGGLKVFFMSMHLATLSDEWQDRIFRRQQHSEVTTTPLSTKTTAKETKERFLIYLASNCVAFREQAFAAISNLSIMGSRGNVMDYGGRCRGSSRNPAINTTNIIAAPDSVTQHKDWTTNHLVLQPYRFALVMENQKRNGYMTEKIVAAFLAGAIPIYYGTHEVFDIFHRDAFIYYDINNPQPALDRIVYLETNRTAYQEVVNGPILKDGEETIRKYFSWNDQLGNGELKWYLRDMIGYG